MTENYPEFLVANLNYAAVTKNQVDGQFFVSGSNPRPIYEISITSGCYLTNLFTSEYFQSIDSNYFNNHFAFLDKNLKFISAASSTSL
jgi:hypothetical protein